MSVGGFNSLRVHMKIKRKIHLTKYRLSEPKIVYYTHLCTQPLRDYIIWKLYRIYYLFMWKSRLDRLQTWWFKMINDWDNLSENTKIHLMLNHMPGVFRDLRVYHYEYKNLEITKRIAGIQKWPA